MGSYTFILVNSKHLEHEYFSNIFIKKTLTIKIKITFL